jgi:hypothetical protein
VAEQGTKDAPSDREPLTMMREVKAVRTALFIGGQQSPHPFGALGRTIQAGAPDVNLTRGQAALLH